MAKKDVSAIVSGMGVGLSILLALDERRRKRGLGDEIMHRLATSEGDALLDRFVDLMAGTNGSAGNSFPITVNYDLRLERMIEDGKYGWKNSDINARHFPIEGKGNAEVTIELVHFNRAMASDEVQKELDEQGLRPANLLELLAFGAKHPDKQREFPIVALGSVWRFLSGYPHVACLDCVGSVRFLDLLWLGDRWYTFCRFAAVRRSA